MVRSSQKRFLSFPVMGAMDIVVVVLEDVDGGEDEGKVGRKEAQALGRGYGRWHGPNTRQQRGGLDARPGSALPHSRSTSTR